MKKIITLIFSVLLFSLSAQLSDKQILDFTKANYLGFIKNMPEQNAAEFGFENKEEIYHLTFGKVLTEYTLVNNTVLKTSNYRVIALNAKGKPCGLFTVFLSPVDRTSLQMADYGATELAKTIQSNAGKFAKGTHLSILRITTTQSDYLFDDSASNTGKKYLKLFENKFYSLTELKKN